MRTSIVSDRVVGQFPISIATSLALEGATGIYPERETGINLLSDYREVWVNVKTIFRNLYNACDRASVLNTPIEDFVEGLNTDMEHFTNAIRDQSQGMMGVVFYLCDYANMALHYPYAQIRGDTTDLQKAYTEAMKKVVQGVLDQQNFEIRLYGHSITDSSSQKLLIVTHYPLDLTVKTLPQKELLESHTGIIKPSHQWYTKYFNGKELPSIPFRQDLMQVFGDSEHFRPMSINIRKQILDIAEKYNWSQVTTTPKIKYGIEQIKDPLVKEILSKIITNQ